MTDLLSAAVLAAVVVVLLTVDMKLFARGREPTLRESVTWSLGWLALGLAAGLVVWATRGKEDAVLYTTVYLIERSLSLDNLFVFLLLFGYFAIPVEQRSWLLFWGIVFAIALRGIAIVAGVALVDQFHFVIYLLAVALLLLAYRIFRSDELEVDPGKNVFVRWVGKVFPVAGDNHERKWFVRIAGSRHATPLLLCLAAIVFTDIAFAADSIPAAFGITRDPFLIWMGNAMALLGLRALFLLVEGMVRRFRYLDETLAIVLALVALKLLLEDVYKVSPEASLATVVVLFAAGIGLSLLAERRERRDTAASQGGPAARLNDREDS